MLKLSPSLLENERYNYTVVRLVQQPWQEQEPLHNAITIPMLSSSRTKGEEWRSPIVTPTRDTIQVDTKLWTSMDVHEIKKNTWSFALSLSLKRIFENSTKGLVPCNFTYNCFGYNNMACPHSFPDVAKIFDWVTRRANTSFLGALHASCMGDSLLKLQKCGHPRMFPFTFS
jgi:hypothetical protein